MKKILSTLTVCVALAGALNAQDPNFSQFFASPLSLNPALTGKFDGSFRVAGNYRNQWPTINNAFVTKTASIDFGILKNRLADIDHIGVFYFSHPFHGFCLYSFLGFIRLYGFCPGHYNCPNHQFFPKAFLTAKAAIGTPIQYIA